MRLVLNMTESQKTRINIFLIFFTPLKIYQNWLTRLNNYIGEVRRLISPFYGYRFVMKVRNYYKHVIRVPQIALCVFVRRHIFKTIWIVYATRSIEVQIQETKGTQQLKFVLLTRTKRNNVVAFKLFISSYLYFPEFKASTKQIFTYHDCNFRFRVP